MERLRRVDLLAALEFLQNVGALRGLAAFQQQAISGLRQIVPCGIASYNEVALGERVLAFTDPPDAYFPGGDAILARHGADNPLILHAQQSGETSTHKFSDFITQDELHRRELYQQLYRGLGVEYQMAFELLSSRSLVIGIALGRELRDFSERDRAVLNILQPHLAQNYRNLAVLEKMQQAFAEGGQAIISLDRNGRVRFTSEAARRLLSAHLGSGTNAERELPEAIRLWVWHEQVRRAIDDDVPPPAETLVIEGLAGRLVVRFLPGGDLADEDLLLLEEQATPDARKLRALGLSPRETEVLNLLSQGKTDAEIADILVVSQRTVQKHLERIYDKLGVRTRTAAAGLAYRQLRSLGHGT